MQRKINKTMIASLIGSAVAIGMTFTMVAKYKHSNGATRMDAQSSMATR